MSEKFDRFYKFEGLTVNSPFSFAEVRVQRHDCGHYSAVIEDFDGQSIDLIESEKTLPDLFGALSAFFNQMGSRCEELAAAEVKKTDTTDTH